MLPQICLELPQLPNQFLATGMQIHSPHFATNTNRFSGTISLNRALSLTIRFQFTRQEPRVMCICVSMEPVTQPYPLQPWQSSWNRQVRWWLSTGVATVTTSAKMNTKWTFRRWLMTLWKSWILWWRNFQARLFCSQDTPWEVLLPQNWSSTSKRICKVANTRRP